MKQRTHGFTVIEVITLILFLGVATIVLFTQRANLVAAQQDTQRKTAINAMYYNLENVYYNAHHSYPAKIDSKVLAAMDPALFTDPKGIALGTSGSDYRYTGENCDISGTDCKSYTLRAELQKEAPYIKTNLHGN
jgi:type II secretory pathway pseudopilin PulG